MDNNEMELLIMNLVTSGGNARSLAMEAISAAREGQIDEARKKLDEAEKALAGVHEIQTDLLTREANGESFRYNLLMTHAQDHVMTAMLASDLAKEMVTLWETIHNRK